MLQGDLVLTISWNDPAAKKAFESLKSANKFVLMRVTEQQVS